MIGSTGNSPHHIGSGYSNPGVVPGGDSAKTTGTEKADGVSRGYGAGVTVSEVKGSPPSLLSQGASNAPAIPEPTSQAAGFKQ